MNFLLLRGLARHQKHWCGFDDRLAKRFGATVHHLDLPGFGTEHARLPPLTVGETMDDVRRRWLEIGVEGPAYLVAISLGGMVAMAWSAAHPEDFAGQVIINSSAKNLGRPWERMSIGALSRVLLAMAAGDPRRRERLVLEATSTLVNEFERMSEESAALDAFAPLSVRHAFRQLAAASRFEAPSSFAIPTLLLAAEGDRLASALCSRRLAERTGADLEVHPSSGHDLPRDDPEWILDRIDAWLSARPAERAQQG